MKDVATTTNELLELMGEEGTLTARKVGSILRKLGFSERFRTCRGIVLPIDRHTEERAHQMAKYHEFYDLEEFVYSDERAKCEWCRILKLVPDGVIEYYQRELKPKEEQRKRRKEAARSLERSTKRRRSLFESPDSPVTTSERD